ncbi:ATP-dependent zinc metalloprotease FtsH [Clostridium sp. D2Q-11]|uniref:ATP-dependent zinc metalloprotease FtsH n=1 Tax=Anaeromonas frigoriresistens TaxID=2683708 RepID=A0A942Z846_9FIRM|nr:ATP-dependent zinc metalloprotease FtsH [Anaeromonas frigoriresistens]MBS4537575.1 ATP-dependent zinc metalloprotease FtsH [Anaeromonas frigoriresistens]
MRKFFRGISAYLLIFVVIIFIVQLLYTGQNNIVELSYTDLRQEIADKNIKEITIIENKVEGTFDDEDNTKFTSYIPDVEKEYKDELESLDEGLEIEGEPDPGTPWFISALPTIFMVLIFVVFWFVFMQQSQGGGGRVMSFGKSKAKLHKEDPKNKITFDDVAGLDEEKEELVEIVDFLKSPKKFMHLGARIPKGVLMVGPPGTGKTYLSKAVSGEAGVPFFSISGSDFVEMFVGVGASRVRDLFEQAKKSSPCIVFIDEIDAVGRRRGAGLGGGHDEREQTLNQLLVEMDGFGINEGIIIIAATNRPDILDPALLRPGRFDRQVQVGVPDINGREAILKIHSKGKPLASNVDLNVIARRTIGFTPADLENLMNEAALLSAREDLKEIPMHVLEEAITKVIAGPEKRSRVRSEKENKLTAYHEAGHAVVGKLLPNTDPVHMVTIMPRGRAGGFTMSLPKEDRSYMSKTEMEEKIVELLGGRVAEKLILNDISTGASNDIERATKIARDMVTHYGMSDKLGPMTYGKDDSEVFLGRDIGRSKDYSEEVAAEIDHEMKRIIEVAYTQAEQLLTKNIDKLHEVAQKLLEQETLNEKEFNNIFDKIDLDKTSNNEDIDNNEK